MDITCIIIIYTTSNHEWGSSKLEISKNIVLFEGFFLISPYLYPLLNLVCEDHYFVVPPGPPSIENDAHVIKKLLLRTRVSEKFLHSEGNLIIQYILVQDQDGQNIRKCHCLASISPAKLQPCLPDFCRYCWFFLLAIHPWNPDILISYFGLFKALQTPCSNGPSTYSWIIRHKLKHAVLIMDNYSHDWP